MTHSQIVRLKALMAAKRCELASEIHTQTKMIVIHDSDPDPIDQVLSMHIREEHAIHLGRRSRVLAEINRSLRAIDEGSYGICIDCEEEISLKRLETIPWASRCIGCQQRLELWEVDERKAA